MLPRQYYGDRRMKNGSVARGFQVAVIATVLALVSGCSQVPSIEVFGAYFPDWLFCIVGAIALVAIVQVYAPKALNLNDLCLESLVSYLAVVSIIAITGWLMVFGG